MANNVNVVVLNGRLVKDVEIKSTKSGTSVARFAIAVNERVKKDGNWMDEANFFDVVVWGKMAETHNTYLTKGKFVSITGKLHQNRWMDKESGKNFSKIEVIADSIEYLSYNKDENAEKKMPVPDVPATDSMPDDVREELFDESDIPF